MAFHKITDDEAFDMLRKASQDMNIKLAEVAREVVAHHNAGRRLPGSAEVPRSAPRESGSPRVSERSGELRG